MTLLELTEAGLTTWVVSTTIARSKLFEPLRLWIASHSSTLYEGVSCQYCLSHWIGFGLVLLQAFNAAWFQAFATCGTLVAVSALIGKILERINKK